MAKNEIKVNITAETTQFERNIEKLKNRLKTAFEINALTLSAVNPFAAISQGIGNFIKGALNDLVDSFKSTLDETREADLLLHVVDISHPDFEEQITVVEKTLADLGCADKPSMIVFNKIDAYTWTEHEEDDLSPVKKGEIPLRDLQKTWMAKLNDNCMFISAREKQNIEEFRETIYNKVRELHVQKYPYNDFLY